MAEIVHSIEELVGRTPLMELVRFQTFEGIHAHILAKLECFNPSGSIKDRAALNMLLTAEASGNIKPGDTIVEQTSGNTGIGIAAFACARGYNVNIFLERGASVERRLLLEAYGVKLLTYKDALGIRTAQESASGWQEPEREALHSEIYSYCEREGYYFLNQACNEANPAAHVKTTGPELWEATDGRIDILVCMAGTGGTGTGLSSFLRSRNPDLKIVLAQPHPDCRITKEHPNVDIIDGVLPAYGVPESELSSFLRPDWSDECIDVRMEEARQTAHKLIRSEGLLMGTSSCAALYAAEVVGARAENEGKNIVVIMPDSGLKYLTTALYR
ncbi:MAG: PLP-dependent cysteine synthase family protein [Lachnospiraceae bacterium]|nr:PLP-dependent cysteine synthase family protein [Lachnospiraceae bacterium]